MDSDTSGRRSAQLSNYSQPNLHQQQSGSAQRAPTMQGTASSTQFQAAQSAGYGYGYYHDVGRPTSDQLQSGLTNPSAEYSRDVPRSPQPQYFQQGVQNMVYNIPQQPQSYQYGWYGNVPPQQQRPFGATIPSEVGVAQQPYFPGGLPTVSAPNMSLSNTTTATAHGTQYYNPTSQQQLTNSYEAYQQPNPVTNAEIGQRTDMESNHAPASPTTRRSEAFANYHRLLRKTLEHAQLDELNEAAEGLRAMADELLGNVQRLGLVFDDLEQRDFRLALWNNFNNAWLAVLNRQMDISQMELSRGEKLETPKGRISGATLQAMGDQLTNLCNDVDEWGLVDYEIGVWEEQIIDLLDPCLEIALKLDGCGSVSGGSKTGKTPKQASQSTSTNKSPGSKRR